MTLPNGKDGLPVKCPHCGTEYEIEFPDETHRGEIYVECGTCQEAYMVKSPHGPAPIDPSKLEDTTGRNADGLLVDEDGVPLPDDQQTVPKFAEDRARAVDRHSVPVVDALSQPAAQTSAAPAEQTAAEG